MDVFTDRTLPELSAVEFDIAAAKLTPLLGSDFNKFAYDGGSVGMVLDAEIGRLIFDYRILLRNVRQKT